MKYDLSIIIPARNEEWLSRTVDDILRHSEGNTEIICVLDGAWATPPIVDNDRVKIIHFPESVGQRAATNQGVRLSKAKYVMKLDAHCAFDQGFDVKMLQAFTEVGDDVTMVPIMRNLHVFNWVCADGHTRYQGPSGPCIGCGLATEKDVVWIPKESPQSSAYRFDSEPHFQYFGELKRKQVGDLVETMSLQGSCFMMTREKYWKLDICDEKFGSWGSQGIEVAVKTWLSGGRVICNRRTWYAHMFRTQGGDFSFPYHNPQSKVSEAKQKAKTLFFENKWPKQIRPLSWLIEHFAPVPGWTPEDIAKIKQYDSVVRQPTKGILYFTDNQLNLKIAKAVQKQLTSIGLPIVSASLKPMEMEGWKNVVLPGPRGYKSYFEQIVAGLEASEAEVIFMCEHDCLYPKEHFDFLPPDPRKIYYDHNWWKVHADGRAVQWNADQVSGLCAYKDVLLPFYKERLAAFNKDNFDRKFEPKSGGAGTGSWRSLVPYIDIRHSGTLTKSKWGLDDFRVKGTALNFIESKVYEIPDWVGLGKMLE